MDSLPSYMVFDKNLVNPTLQVNLSTSGVTSLVDKTYALKSNELGGIKKMRIKIVDCSTIAGSKFTAIASGAAIDSEGS